MNGSLAKACPSVCLDSRRLPALHSATTPVGRVSLHGRRRPPDRLEELSMAAHPVPPPDDFASRPLGPKDGPATWRFLNAGGIRNVFIASQVWRGALSQKSADGTPELWGACSGEELRAVLFHGQGGLAVPAAASADDIAVLGPVLARRAERLRALIGSLDLVDALLPFVEAAGAKTRVRVRELFLE